MNMFFSLNVRRMNANKEKKIISEIQVSSNYPWLYLLSFICYYSYYSYPQVENKTGKVEQGKEVILESKASNLNTGQKIKDSLCNKTIEITNQVLSYSFYCFSKFPLNSVSSSMINFVWKNCTVALCECHFVFDKKKQCKCTQNAYYMQKSSSLFIRKKCGK